MLFQSFCCNFIGVFRSAEGENHAVVDVGEGRAQVIERGAWHELGRASSSRGCGVFGRRRIMGLVEAAKENRRELLHGLAIGGSRIPFHGVLYTIDELEHSEQTLSDLNFVGGHFEIEGGVGNAGAERDGGSGEGSRRKESTLPGLDVPQESGKGLPDGVRLLYKKSLINFPWREKEKDEITEKQKGEEEGKEKEERTGIQRNPVAVAFALRFTIILLIGLIFNAPCPITDSLGAGIVVLLNPSIFSVFLLLDRDGLSGRALDRGNESRLSSRSYVPMRAWGGRAG